MARFLREDAQFANLTASDVTVTVPSFTQTDHLSGIVKAPLNQDYYIDIAAPYTMTLNSFSAACFAGTCTAILKISNVPVSSGLLNVNAASVQTTTCTANNVASAGSFIHITVSSVTSAADLSFAVKYTRTLQ